MQGFVAQMPFVGHTERALLKPWGRENYPRLVKKGQAVAIVEVGSQDTPCLQEACCFCEVFLHFQLSEGIGSRVGQYLLNCCRLDFGLEWQIRIKNPVLAKFKIKAIYKRSWESEAFKDW